ncbi:spindle assembly abnormal protein 4, putative [Plasmodium berghei]|uniref:Spindle assembly abnormal protein 4, putative n=2 Tax=Plasmodium berghei TaxID=5821 RepID=A0A509ASC3_PLABA|nr:spindle assembly abnormal protein 4, putative [Plasmodium berghei ANKA]SCL96826.1 spindle assembly abnormal protein 4, putative [Plasmodium berghei]SCM16497.1 spindle assembly abnormal protein 4, putative [Plasmodium berghei]SCM18291.1 spindle assembly abnormal protein 4, putative [Plasmodium berghei]SCN27720.1 spindle assembly abnormal protein 4, putative [Plasmodium berghei]VUC57603.1 spindle assembly abnormal protein 4, putative [Plasmodium berghei ANKA]|eukprot:XP_034423374.1 spindle assembly abnormal protein 4, putative [Plasmodium berghei ANKA]
MENDSADSDDYYEICNENWTHDTFGELEYTQSLEKNIRKQFNKKESKQNVFFCSDKTQINKSEDKKLNQNDMKESDEIHELKENIDPKNLELNNIIYENDKKKFKAQILKGMISKSNDKNDEEICMLKDIYEELEKGNKDNNKIHMTTSQGENDDESIERDSCFYDDGSPKKHNKSFIKKVKLLNSNNESDNMDSHSNIFNMNDSDLYPWNTLAKSGDYNYENYDNEDNKLNTTNSKDSIFENNKEVELYQKRKSANLSGKYKLNQIKLNDQENDIVNILNDNLNDKIMFYSSINESNKKIIRKDSDYNYINESINKDTNYNINNIPNKYSNNASIVNYDTSFYEKFSSYNKRNINLNESYMFMKRDQTNSPYNNSLSSSIRIFSNDEMTSKSKDNIKIYEKNKANNFEHQLDLSNNKIGYNSEKIDTVLDQQDKIDNEYTKSVNNKKYNNYEKNSCKSSYDNDSTCIQVDLNDEESWNEINNDDKKKKDVKKGEKVKETPKKKYIIPKKGIVTILKDKIIKPNKRKINENSSNKKKEKNQPVILEEYKNDTILKELNAELCNQIKKLENEQDKVKKLEYQLIAKSAEIELEREEMRNKMEDEKKKMIKTIDEEKKKWIKEKKRIENEVEKQRSIIMNKRKLKNDVAILKNKIKELEEKIETDKKQHKFIVDNLKKKIEHISIENDKLKMELKLSDEYRTKMEIYQQNTIMKLATTVAKEKDKNVTDRNNKENDINEKNILYSGNDYVQKDRCSSDLENNRKKEKNREKGNVSKIKGSEHKKKREENDIRKVLNYLDQINDSDKTDSSENSNEFKKIINDQNKKIIQNELDIMYEYTSNDSENYKNCSNTEDGYHDIKLTKKKLLNNDREGKGGKQKNKQKITLDKLFIHEENKTKQNLDSIKKEEYINKNLQKMKCLINKNKDKLINDKRQIQEDEMSLAASEYYKNFKDRFFENCNDEKNDNNYTFLKDQEIQKKSMPYNKTLQLKTENNSKSSIPISNDNSDTTNLSTCNNYLNNMNKINRGNKSSDNAINYFQGQNEMKIEKNINKGEYTNDSNVHSSDTSVYLPNNIYPKHLGNESMSSSSNMNKDISKLNNNNDIFFDKNNLKYENDSKNKAPNNSDHNLNPFGKHWNFIINFNFDELFNICENVIESIFSSSKKIKYRQAFVDGKVETLFDDGLKIIEKNKNKKIIDPTNIVIYLYPSKDYRATFPNSYTLFRFVNKGIYQVNIPGKCQLNKFPNGQIDCKYNDGHVQILFCDGRKKEILPNKEEYAILRNGVIKRLN